MESPYIGVPEDKWTEVTKRLVAAHPLQMTVLREVVLQSWDQIMQTRIGPFQIGVDIHPSPQILGNYLHELIPLNLAERYPGIWRREIEVGEKDLVYIPDDRFSVEIKTSSDKSKIFGNRSYAQKSTAGKKSKSGYYIAVNFEKFPKQRKLGMPSPKIQRIRFGWIDEQDWHGQQAATGQQSHLPSIVYEYKMIDVTTETASTHDR